MKLIKSDHPVFESPAYLNDLLLFNVLDRAIRPTAFLLASDGAHCIIARNRTDLACWVWTSDAISPAGVDEMLDVLQVHFGGREVIVTAKQSIVQAVEERFSGLLYQAPTRTGFIAYRLDTLLAPAAVGQLRAATPDDLDMVCDWCRAFHADCFGQPLTGDPRPLQEAVIAAGHNHLLMVEGRPVCLVRVAPVEGRPYCLVHTVYTPPQYRGRGYAKQAVADAITPYLHQGLFAVLYADAANPRSNAAYQKIGFQPVGTVVELVMARKNATDKTKAPT